MSVSKTSCVYLHSTKKNFLQFKYWAILIWMLSIYFFFIFFENIISGIQLYNKKYPQKLNHFKKLRKMTKDFFNNYIFVHTFQWTSSLWWCPLKCVDEYIVIEEILCHLSRFLKMIKLLVILFFFIFHFLLYVIV